jgi:hypothetical protein
MNSTNGLVPLKIANIDDQKFLPAVEEKFREVQEKLTRYAQTHRDRAIGGKALLTVKVTLLIEKTGDPSIRAEIETKLPSDPPALTFAEFSADEHGPCIKVQRAGSFVDPPRQTRLFTEDGRLIDQSTGEILDAGDQSPPGGATPTPEPRVPPAA